MAELMCLKELMLTKPMVFASVLFAITGIFEINFGLAIVF